MPAKEPRKNQNFEVLRLALVMNGGVSLAVWMGGVATEIYRLIRKDGLYKDLLDFTCTEPRIDIISGASAGGLNGVLLATAIAADLESAQFKEVSQVWLDEGSIKGLLRSPYASDPPSLLDGDKNFEPPIRKVLKRWLQDGAVANDFTPDEDFQLCLTGTFLDGEHRTIPDDYGEIIRDKKHDAVFRFSRADFARKSIARELSLAARSSASFPVAFEPSLCPLNDTTTGADGTADARPNMARSLGLEPCRDSKLLLDGGVLVNKPLRPALDALENAPNSINSRRVLAYIVPDPSERVAQKDDGTRTTTVADVLIASLVTLPGIESISRELDDLRTYQRATRNQHRLRKQLLSASARIKVDVLAEELFDYYKLKRGEASVRRSLETFMSRAFAPGKASKTVRAEGKVLPNFEIVVKDLVAARLDWLPPGFPREAVFFMTPDWPWGITPLEYAVSFLRDIIRRAARLIPRSCEASEDDVLDERLVALAVAADKLEQESAKLTSIRSLDRAYWREKGDKQSPELALDTDRMSDWAKGAYEDWPMGDATKDVKDCATRVCRAYKSGSGDRSTLTAKETHELLARSARSVAVLLFDIRDTLLPVLESVEAPRRDEPAVEMTDAQFLKAMLLESLLPPIAEGSGTKPADEDLAFAVRQLIALFIVQVVTQGHQEPEAPLKLVQISANSSNEVDPQRTWASEKLAGIQLGHFGAFFKRSWRANDFMWGRLDAVQRLTRVLVDPDRLVALGFNSDDAFKMVKNIATGGSGAISDADRAHLEAHWKNRYLNDVKKELKFLDRKKDENSQPPDSVPHSAAAIAYALQVAILQDELPRVARAVKRSYDEGARSDSAKTFVDEIDRLTLTSHRLPADVVQAALATCDVGKERIPDEVGYDLFANTAIDAGAVANAALKGAKSGLGKFRWLFKQLHWLVILPMSGLIKLATARHRGARIAAPLTWALVSAALTLVLVRLLLNVELPRILFLLAVGVLVGLIFSGLLLPIFRRLSVFSASKLEDRKRPR